MVARRKTMFFGFPAGKEAGFRLAAMDFAKQNPRATKGRPYGYDLTHKKRTPYRCAFSAFFGPWRGLGCGPGNYFETFCIISDCPLTGCGLWRYMVRLNLKSQSDCPLAGYGFRGKPSVYGYGNTVSGGSKDKISLSKNIFDKLLRNPNFLQKFGIRPLLNARGNPDGSPAHTPSLRKSYAGGFIDSLKILPNVLWINFCPEKHEKSG